MFQYPVKCKPSKIWKVGVGSLCFAADGYWYCLKDSLPEQVIHGGVGTGQCLLLLSKRFNLSCPGPRTAWHWQSSGKSLFSQLHCRAERTWDWCSPGWVDGTSPLRLVWEWTFLIILHLQQFKFQLIHSSLPIKNSRLWYVFQTAGKDQSSQLFDKCSNQILGGRKIGGKENVIWSMKS